jgi:hypothetical protein
MDKFLWSTSMFSFVKQKKVLAALGEIAPRVVPRLTTLSPIEKAQVLAVSNAFMVAGGFIYGRGFSHSPMALDLKDEPKVDQRYDAVLEFADQLELIHQVAPKVDGLRMDDPKLAAFKRELSGCEVALVTAGAVFHEGARRAAIDGWRSLSKAIPFAGDAVKLLLLYQKTHSLEPVVRINGKAPDATLLLSLASTLPPMFSPPKPSGQGKKQ